MHQQEESLAVLQNAIFALGTVAKSAEGSQHIVAAGGIATLGSGMAAHMASAECARQPPSR